MTTVPPDRELVITRIFNAPRRLVYQAWADPAQAIKWMGPRSHPATLFESDSRPGGKWRGCLRSVETGEELWQGGTNLEAIEPERLVFTFAWHDDNGHPEHEMTITVTFEDQGDKTKLTLRQSIFKSVEQRDGHNGGWTSSLDRLEDYLAQ